MRFTIFYFSGTGNTMYAAGYMAHVLKDMGHRAKAVNIERLDSNRKGSLIEQADVLFLMYPIYGSDMPENMKVFIDTLPLMKQKPLGVVCTQLLFSGDGGSIMHNELKQKGYDQRWSLQLLMPNNLAIKGSPFAINDAYNHHENIYLKKARYNIRRLCEAVIADKKRVYDNTPFHKLLAMTQRPFYRLFEKTVFVNKLDIDEKACTRCKLCMTVCPNQVFTLKENQIHIIHKDRCTFCLRCLNYCEASAITFAGSKSKKTYKGPTPYIRRKIKQDAQYHIKQVTASNKGFKMLVRLLDASLLAQYKNLQKQYDLYNASEDLDYIIVMYHGTLPVGCCGYKIYSDDVTELKRLYVQEAYRGQQLAQRLVMACERKSSESGFKWMILETGIKQEAAIGLYKKMGYTVRLAYEPYIGNDNSVCMSRHL